LRQVNSECETIFSFLFFSLDYFCIKQHAQLKKAKRRTSLP